MKCINKFVFSLMVLLFAGSAFGQSYRDFRINEMLIKNTDNYVDEYGRHVPWVEIYNSAYNTVNLYDCFLTDDTTGFSAVKKGASIPSHWYRIPKGDPKTAVQQCSYLVFFMDGDPLYGTFHVTFDLRKSKTDYVALISANGKEIIDIMQYPKALCDTELAYGCKTDGIRDSIGYLRQFTPGSTNVVIVQTTKAEKLIHDDPYGFGLSIISMTVVFIALILIYLMLKLFARTTARRARKSAAKKNGVINPSAPATLANGENTNIDSPNSEEAAAIAMALQLHFNSLHDEESEVLTIEMPSAHYSPWSQKGLMMRRNPKLR